MWFDGCLAFEFRVTWLQWLKFFANTFFSGDALYLKVFTIVRPGADAVV